MDTVYGTKKYFQSLAADNNDYYNRNTTTNRTIIPNYSSYQNTLGRCSVGPFSHINKYPYQNDISLTSQYGYNSWGMWKDSRNLTPQSSISAKSKKRSIKSFTILLMTAAFIVMLAVLSIAALAFYFSTFKSEINDSIMVFDGRFQISRGDMFTTGLKYNHTSVFQQKAEFYENIIVKSIEQNGLDVAKCKVFGFGDGPLINVIFRISLDMRRIPITIKSVEDHIKDSILKEFANPKSLFQGIQIDVNSMEIKRLLDKDAYNAASFVKLSATTASSALFDDTIVTTRPTLMDKSFTKISSSIKTKTKPIVESDVDMENAPIIQGSFEVTQTDADITKKKGLPVTTSTLRPFTITNNGMRIKTKKTTIEKVKLPNKSAETTTINKAIIESVTDMPEKKSNSDFKKNLLKVVPLSTTEKPKSVEIPKSTAPKTTKLTTTPSTKPTTVKPIVTTTPENISTVNASQSALILETTTEKLKFDANLYTLSLNANEEPWLPINPTVPSRKKINNSQSKNEAAEIKPKNVAKLPTLQYRNKIRYSESQTDNPNKELFYHSFSNPAFTFSPPGIETLGTGIVRPYPIPVNKINNENYTPDFQYVQPMVQLNIDEYNRDTLHLLDEKRFEHLGSGVIVKKQEIPILETKLIETTTTEEPAESKLGDLLLDLLDFSKDKFQSPQISTTTTTEKSQNVGFSNIKDFIMQSTKNNSTSHGTTTTTKDGLTTTKNTKQPEKFFVTKKRPENTIISSSTPRSFSENATNPTKSTSAYIEIETFKYTPTVESWNQPSLFPVQSKLEYTNGTTMSLADKKVIRRIFNETLQAWIVENSQNKFQDSNRSDGDGERNYTQQLQNISAIFDTLASKLGMTPDFSTKLPPFTSFSQNKIKNKTIYSNIKIPQPIEPSFNDSTNTASVSTESSITMPILLISSTEQQYLPSSQDTVIGEAEIEEVDPTQYEQMLLLNNKLPGSTSSTTLPSLITLMPVKSNSGIRRNGGLEIIEKYKIASTAASDRAFKRKAPPASVIQAEINVQEQLGSF